MKSLEELRQKSPRQFEEYIARILPNMGYKNINLTSLTADSGYDISAYKNDFKVLFECKRYSDQNKVGSRDVRIFADACRRMKADKGIFVTTSSFTSTVVEEQRSREIDIEFWDGKELLRQLKNSEKVNAFCIQCNKKLSGYYTEFHWKRNVVETMNSPEMRKLVYAMKEDLVPVNPRQCKGCKYYFICASCLKKFDIRCEKTPLYYDKQYCKECYRNRKKRNKKLKIIIILIILAFLIAGTLFIIHLFIANTHIALLLLLVIVMIVISVPTTNTSRKKGN